MDDFRIDNVRALQWLLVVAACGGLYVYGMAMKRAALRAFVSARLAPMLAPDVSRGRQWLRAALVLAAMALIVAGLVGPRWGTYYDEVQRRRLDLVICLDVSRSMLAEDAGMSRLDRAKDDIRRLLDRLSGGMVGVVAFAGRAELVCPLTDDYEFYRMALDDAGLHSAAVGGTNIGEAIRAGARTFGPMGARDRAIILVTDGEDHGESAIAEARKARDAGILVFAVGIGDDDQGALIPIDRDGQRTYVKYDDELVWSKLDPAALKAIVSAGGGEYQPSRQVTPRQRTLEWLYSERLSPMEERTNQERKVARQYPRFHWFAAMALALLVIEPFISERRSGAGQRGESRRKLAA
jgi:Ca-activated chloride channel family protein